MEFTIESIFKALRAPLAVVDNPERRSQIEDYIEAARPPLERSVFDLLSSFAEGVDAEVGANYKVSLRYRPGALDLEVRASEQEAEPDEAWTRAEGEVEKITLRLPAELKDLATEAASKSGLSVNSWFVRVLARALRSAQGMEPPEPPETGRRRRRRGRPGQRLSGWIGPQT